MNPPDRTAIYRVSRNGHVMGEFDIDRIVELLDSGEFMWTDLCWTQGAAGWSPLTVLRSEVAAAKAFPPVARVVTPMAPGRRAPQAPSPVSSNASAIKPAYSWLWICGVCALGAVIGLLTTHFFPTIVMVDRPVEKIVEKPVEVVRIVEKRIDVPAELDSHQRVAIRFFDRLRDMKGHKEGGNLLKISDRVKVLVSITGNGTHAVSLELIRSRCESAFRRQGFKVLSESSEEYPYSVVRVTGSMLNTEISRANVVSGSYTVKIGQFVTYYDPFADPADPATVLKTEDVELYENGGVFIYGSTFYHKITDAFTTTAELAANELRKASDN